MLWYLFSRSVQKEASLTQKLDRSGKYTTGKSQILQAQLNFDYWQINQNLLTSE